MPFGAQRDRVRGFADRLAYCDSCRGALAELASIQDSDERNNLLKTISRVACSKSLDRRWFHAVLLMGFFRGLSELQVEIVATFANMIESATLRERPNTLCKHQHISYGLKTINAVLLDTSPSAVPYPHEPLSVMGLALIDDLTGRLLSPDYYRRVLVVLGLVEPRVRAVLLELITYTAFESVGACEWCYAVMTMVLIAELPDAEMTIVDAFADVMLFAKLLGGYCTRPLPRIIPGLWEEVPVPAIAHGQNPTEDTP
jgi:hypothetical protein